MKKLSLSSTFLLTTLLFTSWTPQASAQLLSEEWLSEASRSSVVESFGDDPGLVKYVEACDCCCGPTWKFAADAAFMQRSTPDSVLLMQRLVLNPLTLTPLLNADSLDFGFAPGWDVALERQSHWGGIEARLLSIDGWDAANAITLGAPTFVRIPNAVPFATLPGVTAINATYNSELLSAELNLRRQLSDCVSLLGGFRYLELDEHLHADLNSAARLSTYDTLTRNRLYGAQLGAGGTLWCRDRLTVEGLAKAGIFGNSGAQNTIFDTGLAVATAADTSDRAAFVGELAFTANYCLTDALSLRASYDLLWIETVALASDQILATNFATMRGISADGGAFYHGAFVGLEYCR